MILAVDIGNTNINFGLFDADVLVNHFRIDANKFQQNSRVIENYWNKIEIGKVDKIVTASVNPETESLFCQWTQKKCQKVPIKIGTDIKPKIPVKVNNPTNVGIDRIVNAVAAYNLMQKELIIVDIGTAITFDVVSGVGEFIGGVIAPGIKMCANALHVQTGQLPQVKAGRTETVLGKDTESAMISGIYWGAIGTVNIILERLFAELKFKPTVIVTGGDAELIAGSVKHITKVIPHLTLDGIRIVYEKK